eukprot:TRINITY_DN5519_c0_g2_i1.p1 TRINITY_DN5519_c0_g2~~TRINITY_DN5519_c0_g2_i1.p1  ORF type:complete len:134 (-),score=36.12 TRINITY_DN5519_c0_g2_i1:63-431(-)
MLAHESEEVQKAAQNGLKTILKAGYPLHNMFINNKTTGERFQVDLSQVASLNDLKSKIQTESGVSPSYQLLSCGGKVIHRGKLQSFNLNDDSTIDMEVTMNGGCSESCGGCGFGESCSCTIL